MPEQFLGYFCFRCRKKIYLLGKDCHRTEPGRFLCNACYTARAAENREERLKQEAATADYEKGLPELPMEEE